jgi:hypothetical protein
LMQVISLNFATIPRRTILRRCAFRLEGKTEARLLKQIAGPSRYAAR